MAGCNNCGRKGLFLKVTDGLCKACLAAKRQNLQVEQSENDRKYDLYMEAWQDEQYRSIQSKYYRLIEDIETDYTVFINGLGGEEAGTKLEKKCIQGTILFHELVPFWKKYELSIPNSSPPFKRLSMLKEKRGDYEGAALACVQQMRLGVFGDSSKGGMRGRLARLIRKGNLYQNEELMREASKYLEI